MCETYWTCTRDEFQDHGARRNSRRPWDLKVYERWIPRPWGQRKLLKALRPELLREMDSETMRPEKTLEGPETWTITRDGFQHHEARENSRRTWDLSLREMDSKTMRPDKTLEGPETCTFTRDGFQDHEARENSRRPWDLKCEKRICLVRKMEFRAMRPEYHRRLRDLKCVEHTWLLREKVVATMRPEKPLEGHETWNV